MIIQPKAVFFKKAKHRWAFFISDFQMRECTKKKHSVKKVKPIRDFRFSGNVCTTSFQYKLLKFYLVVVESWKRLNAIEEKLKVVKDLQWGSVGSVIKFQETIKEQIIAT